MIQGHATPAGTAQFAARYPHHLAQNFFRPAQGLTVSSIGIGSYLGHMTAEADESYRQATLAAVHGGINFIDTSLNYRHQRSERSIGAALRDLADSGRFDRTGLIVCSKAGYLVPDALPVAGLQSADVAGNMHCMAPAFLEDQLERSRQNLGLETIDVFYLHNPETQLQYVDSERFYARMRTAFEALEAFVRSGRIRFYGTATWNGYRRNGMADGLSLSRLASIAQEVAGADHRFRFIQLPFNLGMTEAYGQHKAETVDGDRCSVLEAAARLGITTVASASLLQARLASGLPETLAERLPGPTNDAGRAIQFARSVPGIAVALVGMSRVAHVEENLAAAAYPPLGADAFHALFG